MTKKNKRLLAVIGVLFFLMAVAYAATAFYFTKHFYSGTSVNGIDCTYQGTEEVKSQAAESVRDYQLSIQTLEGNFETVNAEQIQLSFVDDGEIERLLKEQEPWFWIREIFKNKIHELKISVQFSEESLAGAVDGLACMQEENITFPQDASIQETDNGYAIAPEVEGNQLDREKVIALLKDAILAGKTEVNLADGGCYVKPSVYQDNETLVNHVNRRNQLVSANLTIDFGSDRTETIGAVLLKSWMIQDEAGNDMIDPNQIVSYVNTLAEKYNTVGSTRTFHKTGGGTIQLSGGDYGWVMDTETTAADLTEAIAAGTQGSFEVTYTNSAKSRARNDIGNSYVEISIDSQTMWCYVDGKLLVTTPVVTGCVAKGTETPKGGVWKVKGRRTDYTMKGKIDPATGEPSYTAHCNYWIPYSEDLTIGLHDLVTRSAFGGDIYLTNGSHGCVNTPLEAVKQIYDVVAYGFPVIVY